MDERDDHRSSDADELSEQERGGEPAGEPTSQPPAASAVGTHDPHAAHTFEPDRSEMSSDEPNPAGSSETGDAPTLAAGLSALLFYLAEPTPRATLAAHLATTDAEIEAALPALRAQLEAVGLTLITEGETLSLRTAPAVSPLIKAVERKELTRDIGRAGAETLAIVLYKGPLTRAEIDHIRGVNSAYILRTLQVRGLVERLEARSGARVHYYRATSELLAHLGVASIDELPDYHVLQDKLARHASAGERGGE
ncbi:hypothetical protein GVX82_05185 [Patescibacteria group bacterium]|jgi:segregation and condensation protein B|nr:hypothetical protein [Patescibacteria group bacterium]